MDGAFNDYIDYPQNSLQLEPFSLRLFWKTKDGERIYIEDMETSHIENICRAGIEGRLAMDEQTEDRFLLELSIRRERNLK